jgi:hypothetical protein
MGIFGHNSPSELDGLEPRSLYWHLTVRITDGVGDVSSCGSTGASRMQGGSALDETAAAA